jgi:N-acetylglutamate synthase-like GNAT family acetyltransferase
VAQPQARIRPLGRPGDLGWMVMAHGQLYAEEFGWNGRFEALVAKIVADYAQRARPEVDQAWIAELDGRRVGCVLCTGTDQPGTAQLRTLLVDLAARGHGLGGRLVDACIGFAAGAGYRRIRLWTNEPLAAARTVYLSRGFRLVQEDAVPHHDFGPPLVGQLYELALAGPTSG